MNLDLFCRLYPTTSTPELMKRFGITEKRVQQIARDHKLKRTAVAKAPAVEQEPVDPAPGVYVLPSPGPGWGPILVHRTFAR